MPSLNIRGIPRLPIHWHGKAMIRLAEQHGEELVYMTMCVYVLGYCSEVIPSGRLPASSITLLTDFSRPDKGGHERVRAFAAHVR